MTVEFRAVYLEPRMRRRRLANAMVHFALHEAREQCVRQRCRGCGAPAWAAAKLADMQAWVVLPHCMQTSANFWAGVGFVLGSEVDPKEAKMAMLRSRRDLRGDVSSWTLLMEEASSPHAAPAEASARRRADAAEAHCRCQQHYCA